MQNKYKLNHSLFIFGLMILFFIAAFPLVQAQTAAPGDLDMTFGSGGKVVTSITEFYDSPTRMRIQPDGKIVTNGIVQNAALNLTATFVVRHNANGSVDTSFGRNGSFIAECCDDAFGSPVFYDFVVQPDGKLLLTGGDYTGYFSYGIYTVRLNANGTLDYTFGYKGGIFTTVPGETFGSVGGNIALQADGKIVVLGSTFSSPDVADKVVLVRYNANGTPDTSFGAGGTVITTVGTNLINNRELLFQPDGKILAAGHANFSGNINAYVARYNIDGTLDTGFGTNGIVGVDINNNFNKVGRMALQPDGKIVVNGENFNNPGDAVISSSIFRLDVNGAVDTTFGTNGFVIIPAANSNEGVGKTLALQQNGKILTAAHRSGTFATLRYNSNGTIDNSFGSNGVVTTVVGSNPGADGISSLAVQTDGKIVAAGGVRNASNSFDVGLVRYLGDSLIPAANNLVSGRVVVPDGRGLRNATVSITDSNGVSRATTTSSFGFFSFDNVRTGGTYTFSVSSRLYRFAPRTVQVDGNLTLADFMGLE